MIHTEYRCPKCEMPHGGPWVTCHICGYSKLVKHWKEDLYCIAEQIQDLTADLSADNDAAERKELAHTEDPKQWRERVWAPPDTKDGE